MSYSSKLDKCFNSMDAMTDRQKIEVALSALIKNADTGAKSFTNIPLTWMEWKSFFKDHSIPIENAEKSCESSIALNLVEIKVIEEFNNNFRELVARMGL